MPRADSDLDVVSERLRRSRFLGQGAGCRASYGGLAPDMNAVDWLMGSDPSIRWQVMHDLSDAPDDLVAAERSKVATHCWGAELLARQTPDGQWGGDPSIPKWTSSPEWFAMKTLVWLRDLGLDPSSDEACRAVALTREHVTWHWFDDHPFFVGEVEPCINGRVVAIGANFGQDVTGLVDRLLREQMDDGGWNCEQEHGSTRGSFHTTINVLEGLLAYEHAVGGAGDVPAARLRGEEYLLERRMLRRLSTGEIVDPTFTQPSFPTGYHYDVLRGLDHLRRAGATPDERVVEAIDIVESKRREDGRWVLENPDPDQLDLELGDWPRLACAAK